jgi:hypothetical protein
MILESKRRTLLDVDLTVWAEVKRFATIRRLCVSDAVQLLLEIGLSRFGYNPLQDTKQEFGSLSSVRGNV